MEIPLIDGRRRRAYDVACVAKVGLEYLTALTAAHDPSQGNLETFKTEARGLRKIFRKALHQDESHWNEQWESIQDNEAEECRMSPHVIGVNRAVFEPTGISGGGPGQRSSKARHRGRRCTQQINQERSPSLEAGDISKGKYQIVYMQPEFMRGNNPQFRRIVAPNTTTSMRKVCLKDEAKDQQMKGGGFDEAERMRRWWRRMMMQPTQLRCESSHSYVILLSTHSSSRTTAKIPVLHQLTPQNSTERPKTTACSSNTQNPSSPAAIKHRTTAHLQSAVAEEAYKEIINGRVPFKLEFCFEELGEGAELVFGGASFLQLRAMAVGGGN